ncbi:hypothetical protein ACIPSA_15245 [Streptomyces sp. NPDC086549]
MHGALAHPGDELEAENRRDPAVARALRELLDGRAPGEVASPVS